jgi:hypothetical protein
MSIIFLPRRAFQAFGCLYVSYWALFFGIVAFLIINSYLREHRHHPAGNTASHELHYDHKIATTGKGDE